jgi:mono/diheme cytochrome c family protein
LTEIPEHLLKRAAQRRAALGGGDAPADSEAPAAEAGAAPKADAPSAAVAKAPAAPAPLPSLEESAPKAKPDIPVVAAAKARKRIPYWAAPVLALLPVWGIIYASAMKPPPSGQVDALTLGGEVYVSAGCSGCHKDDGAGVTAGGTGAQINDGHVLETFADPLANVHWIAYGAKDGARADGTYGDVNRPLIKNAMPAFKDTLSPEEIAAVTIYIREVLSGGKPEDDPNFNPDKFNEDPAALEAEVQAVIDLGPGGDPDIASVDGAETK